MADMAVPRTKARVPRGTLIGGVVALAALLIMLPLIAIAVFRPVVGGGTKVGVVVANRDIAIRTNVQPGDLTIRQIAVDDVPPGAFLRVDQAKGMVAAANLVKGEPITSNLVVKAGDAVGTPDFAYLPLPSGYVAVTIPANEEQAVAGYIQAGDYISVIATVPALKSDGSPANSNNTRTVFTNLHVIRVGTAAANDAKPAAAPGQQTAVQQPALTSLTVVMTQCQAEVMDWFMGNAQLKYTLESYKDYKPNDQPDQSCPGVGSAQGMTRNDIGNRYPGIFKS